MEWALLPDLAHYSIINPSLKIGQQFMPYTKFPEWLGKNSSTIKIKRLNKELS